MVKLYSDYFSNLSSSVLGERVFDFIDIEDAVLNTFRTKIQEKNFAFLLLNPNSELIQSDAQPMWLIDAGFLLLKHHSDRNGTIEEKIIKFNECNTALDEIIRIMLDDSKNGNELFNYSINSSEQLRLKATPKITSGDLSYIGYLVTFSFERFFIDCIEKTNC